MNDTFVKEVLDPPVQVIEGNFILRKLTVDEVEKDYKALMSSKESLRQIFSLDDTWPADDMTLEENYEDLKRHQEEFDNREGFAYTIVNKDDTECIGCVYIWPWTHDIEKEYDALVFYWVTDKMKAVDFELQLDGYIDYWLKSFWKIKNPLMPGRNISLEKWSDIVKIIESKK